MVETRAESTLVSYACAQYSMWWGHVPTASSHSSSSSSSCSSSSTWIGAAQLDPALVDVDVDLGLALAGLGTKLLAGFFFAAGTANASASSSSEGMKGMTRGCNCGTRAPQALHFVALDALRSVHALQTQPSSLWLCSLVLQASQLTLLNGFFSVHFGHTTVSLLVPADGMLDCDDSYAVEVVQSGGMKVPVATLARLLGSPVFSIKSAAARSSLDIGCARFNTAWHRRLTASMRNQCGTRGRCACVKYDGARHSEL